jgi:uncharacterized protein YwgA
MKSGPEFQRLKFSCHDIGNIYSQHISSKIADWFIKKQKKEEVEGIFASLTDADRGMVAFTYDEVVKQIDHFIESIEKHVNAGAFNDAEEERLKFKVESKDITDALVKFNGELSDLVIKFAKIARVPVTI